MNILVIPISTPLKLGLYDQNNKLVKTIEKNGKTSDILPLMFQELISKYQIKNIFYINGPGSYMSIKVAYMFLKSFSVVKQIPFYGCSGFEFNENSPIKALGKKYFFNDKDGTIRLDFLNKEDIIKEFKLPTKLDQSIFSKSCLPNYNLPAVN